jgi:tRNA-splicing ligase RtcB
MDQVLNLSNLAFAFHHIAIMPDCHQGYGMPIGGVMATNNVVVPNAVGVDIGCGVQAVSTSVSELSMDMLKSIMGDIRVMVPVGFKHRTEPVCWDGFDSVPDTRVITSELSNAKYQLGTLGGCNHFIEIQKSDTGNVWIMIHSGSRNFGFKIAHAYHEYAVNLCNRWYSGIPTPELAFLPMGDPIAGEYIDSMQFALEFARENRNRIMGSIMTAFITHVPGVQFGDPIDIHHNYAAIEHHFGSNVMVHRKGAVRVREGEIGIVPGSQGTASYITRGKGNLESFCSCSHGAGRRLGRKQAQRELDYDAEVALLNNAGILHSIRSIGDLDEASGAYKDIDMVMSAQTDLVDIVTKLTPLGVIKG